MNTMQRTLFAILALLISGCGDSADPPVLPTVDMAIGSRTFHLEIAANDADRQKGLMYRDSMPTDRGMIFVFAEQRQGVLDAQHGIPLDIIFVNAGGEVV